MYTFRAKLLRSSSLSFKDETRFICDKAWGHYGINYSSITTSSSNSQDFFIENLHFSSCLQFLNDDSGNGGDDILRNIAY